MNILKYSIRRKTVVLFSLILLVFILGLYYSTYLTVFKNIDAIEKNEAQKTVNRFFHALRTELNHLEIAAKDYAVWDQSYNFIDNQNQAFIEENLQSEIMGNYEIDFLTFYNLKLENVFTQSQNFSTGQLTNLRQEISDIIKKQLNLNLKNLGLNNNKLIIKIPDFNYPVFVVIYPIYRNNTIGQANGFLVFAKILDYKNLTKIGNDIQEHLSFVFNQKKDLFTNNDSIVIEQHPEYNTLLIGIKDYRNEEATVVTLNLKTIVRGESKQNSLFLVLLFLAGGILIIISISFYIQKVLFKSLRNFTDSIMEIGDKHDLSIRLSEEQFDEFSELYQSFNKMLQRLEKSENELAERMNLMKDILDNVDQGFLVFGQDCRILPEYSQQCVKLFKTFPDDQLFPELLFPEDQEQQIFLSQIMSRILSEQNNAKQEIYLSLLPSEILLFNRTINLKYKILKASNDCTSLTMMVILTDLSEKKNIQTEVEKEQQILKMVVKVVVDYNDFMTLVSEYRHFALFRVFEILRDEKVSSDLKTTEIIRQIHTFKGNFGQFDMFGIYNKLNDLESEYFANIELLKCSDPFTILNFLSRFNLLEWLDNEMKILKVTLGESYFSSGHRYWITREKLNDIENKILAYLPVYKYRSILPELKKIMFNPFKEMFNYHLNYIGYLSNSQQKPLKAVNIKGGEFMVDTILYNPLVKSLVHIFRNSIDHGIETPEERLIANKDELGEIKIEISKTDEIIEIKISDDGRGINLEKIVAKAVDKKLIDYSLAQHLPREEILNFIFRPEFSTSERASDLSGRGMGLSAVKTEVEKINGTIRVETSPGAGAAFIFALPAENDYEKIYKITIFDIMNHLIREVKTLLHRDLKIEISTQNEINLHRAPQLMLRRYSALITIFGVVKGQFVISADANLASQITAYFLGSGNELCSKGKYIESSLAEFSNVAIGNTIKEFSDFEQVLNFNSPSTITSEKTVIKYLDSQVWNCDIATEKGNLNVNLVTPNKA